MDAKNRHKRVNTHASVELERVILLTLSLRAREWHNSGVAAAYELVAVLKPQRPEAFTAPQDDGTTAPRSTRRNSSPDAVDDEDEDGGRRGDARA